MLKVNKKEVFDIGVLIEACKKEIVSWGYKIDDKHVWYLENGYQLEDDGRYNLYMNSKNFGFIWDEEKPEADNEIVFCELIKELGGKKKDWVSVKINTGEVVGLQEYLDGYDEYGRYLDRMKITAVNKNGTPLALSNFAHTGKGHEGDKNYVRLRLSYLSYKSPETVCKELASDDKIYNNSFKVVKDEWDRCEILTKDTLGNEALFKIVF